MYSIIYMSPNLIEIFCSLSNRKKSDVIDKKARNSVVNLNKVQVIK